MQVINSAVLSFHGELWVPGADNLGMHPSFPRIDLRPGITEPVVLMISRRQVRDRDLSSILDSLKPLTAAREDAWLYRGQMALVIDGFNDDPRELIEIPEVREIVKALCAAWPYWGFFMNQVDDSLKIVAGCICADSFPGSGAAEIDVQKLNAFISQGFDGMNALFDKHGFPEKELELMSLGLVEYFGLAG